MRKLIYNVMLMAALLLTACITATAQQRRPIDSQHPLWLVHIDVWNAADPQKIINLIPDDIKPFVCMNLSMSCAYDTERGVYQRPQSALRTYKSWASICQANGLWFTCQPASGGHTHIQDDDLETFEYFFKTYPNFLGWNYAEQFWGFDEPNDKSSSTQASRIALFAKLIPMHHKYGGFLTISFCGNIWSHALNPVGMLKRNKDLMAASKQYPEAILWLYKYTTSTCFYNNESVSFGPFMAGLAKNYGVRYDNCGYNGALDAILGEKHGKKYPVAAGIGTVMEQTCQNGGAVWDGPELIWTEDFQNLSDTKDASNYTQRNWGTFPGFRNIWLDMFHKIVDGTMYIPSREEVIGNTKYIIVNDVTSGNDEDKYAAWGNLYDGLYKQTDPFNRGNGQMNDNMSYFKSTGRYGTIAVAPELYDDLSKTIPNVVKKSNRNNVFSTQSAKEALFNAAYPSISTGSLFVSRNRNQLVTYFPFTYLSSKIIASAKIPLQYNTCSTLNLKYGKFGNGLVHEFEDHINVYLNNYRTDTTTMVSDVISVEGVTGTPSYTMTKRAEALATATDEWNAETGTYTITVKHNGPVDITVNCSGNATDRKTDYIMPKALEMPKQPEPFHGELIIEAEDMNYRSIAGCNTFPYASHPALRGHSGNGFIDMGKNTAGSIKATVREPKAGTYRVEMRYSNCNASSIRCNVFNGSTVSKIFTLEKAAYNEWKKASFEVELREGSNTLTLYNTLGTAMYIDQFIITPAEMPVRSYAVTTREIEHGTATASVSEASEGETVTLKAEPTKGYILSGWNIIHGDINIQQSAGEDNEFTFTMIDDNVTVEPIFADASAIYTMDMASPLAGTIPAGWRVNQSGDGTDIHAYPNTYSSGSRVMGGFSGTYGKGLYWRVGNADYGRLNGYSLHLKPGTYKLTFAMAAWVGAPQYKAQILSSSDKLVKETSYFTAAPNAAQNSGANLSSAVKRVMEFTISAEGDYVINFENKTKGDFSEFLLLDCRINSTEDPTAVIDNIMTKISGSDSYDIFDAQGRQHSSLQKGMNIIRQKGVDVKKIYIR